MVNLKEYVIPVLFSVGMTLIIQRYFFYHRIDQKEAIVAQQSSQPLVFDIPLDNQNNALGEVKTEVATTWAALEFSTQGAALSRIKSYLNGAVIETFHTNESAQEQRNFLLFFDTVSAPYQYRLIKHTHDTDGHHVIYEGRNNHAIVTKEFFVENQKPIINLSVTIKSLKDTLVPRLLVYGPMDHNDPLNLIAIDQNNLFNKKIVSNNVLENFPLIAPSVVGLDSRYFLCALYDASLLAIDKVYYRLFDEYAALVVQMNPVEKVTVYTTSWYCGSKKADLLHSVDARLEKVLDYYGWFSWLSKFLLMILNFLYAYCKSYGLAIILLTFLMKIVLLPFTFSSERSIRQQKEFQKKMSYIQTKYKHDTEQLKYEQALLIRKHGLPWVGGCLPMLLQIPFFFALSRLLSYATELYQSPFLWIGNLSARDPWFILPLLVFVSMIFSALQADDKQQIALLVMAIFFAGVTANLASGLALYFIANGFANIAQTWLIKKWSGRSEH